MAGAGRILVVDDNAASRELVRYLLLKPGREVFEAADGLEALRQIEETGPDLVLLDLEMPALDGFGVLKRMRADPRFAGLRVLAVTANAMHGERERALAAGFDGYITKPIHGTLLRQRVDELLSSRAGEPRP